ncbi:MAG: tRNA pseudouridine(55) synthase TruB [Candidatus Binatia bacterium]
MHGILLVDKPARMTSAGVVRDVKRRLGGVKVGHLGTLDPFATGLLPLAIGEGAKIVPFLNQEEKSYHGTITLGTTTDTLDATGRTTETAPIPPLTQAAVDEVTRRFVGEIEQVPPMYSALKRGGVPLYRLARKGVEVELSPRRVHIAVLSLVLVSAESISLSIDCSKGTYVRSLARDVAIALGTVGHVSMLRRTAFGMFRLSEAVPLDQVSAGGSGLMSLREALGRLRELSATERLVADIRAGRQAGLASLPVAEFAGEVAKLVGPEGEIVAMVGASGSAWKLLRVFARHADEIPGRLTDRETRR